MKTVQTIFQALQDVIKIKLLNTAPAKDLVKKKAAAEQVVLHSAVGRLIFSDSKKPLHNIELELWDRDIGTPGDFLGVGITDSNGYFRIEYDPQKAGFMDAPDLELRVIEIRSTFNNKNELVFSKRLAYTIKGQDNVDQLEYDFGTKTVPYWLYEPTHPFPRLMFSALQDPPDVYSVGRTLKGYEVAEVYQTIQARHRIANALHSNQPSLAAIQTDYPPNLTLKLEKEQPGYTRSDEFLGLRVLNGMNPCLLQHHPDNPQRYRVSFNWDAYEKNPRYDLHNVEAFFEIKAGKFLPVEITVQSRYPDSLAPFSPLQESVTYTPESGDLWLQAKRIFRTNYLFTAELVEHYIKSHLQMEQYAIAVFRNLRKNPLRILLLPHLKSLVNINQRADTILVSDSGYVTSAGPLSAKSVIQICQERMSTMDWQGWQPRQPLTEDHNYAQVANLYWKLLGEYLDAFFQKHQPAIIQEWAEIRALSEDLVEHSVVYSPATKSDGWEFYDSHELDQPEIPRSPFNGKVKAIRPITLTDQPNDSDLANLKQFCRYVIFHATLWHSWVNDCQPQDGGEVVYSCLALRNGSLGSENDPEIAPPPLDASQLLFLVHTLSEIEYGYILKNEDGDIPPELRNILLSAKKEFAKLNFDVSKIRALINI